MIENIEDPWMVQGGPAFPCADREGSHYKGMSLRDYFAAKAIQGMLAGNVPFADVGYEPKVKATIMEHQAIAAYKMADAMLKASEEK